MVAHGTAPDWGVRKHKLGTFGPGSEIGTGWRAGLGSWAGSRADMCYKQVWVCPQVTSDCTVGLSVQQHPGLPPAPEGSQCWGRAPTAARRGFPGGEARCPVTTGSAVQGDRRARVSDTISVFFQLHGQLAGS